MNRSLLMLFIALFAGSLMLSSCAGGGNQETETEAEKEADKMESAEDMAEEMTSDDSEDMETEESADMVDLSGDEAAEITISTPGKTMTEMRYDINAIKISAGQTLKLQLMNTGEGDAMQHNWILVKEADAQAVATAGIQSGADNGFVPVDDERVIAATKLLKPGEEDQIEVVVDEPGTYAYICTYPGHYPQMKGTLVVE